MSGQRARVPYPPSPPSPPSRNYRHALAGLRAAPHESAPLAAPARLRASGSGRWRDATCARGPMRTEEASGVGRVRVRVSRGGGESGSAGLGRIRRPRGAAAAGGAAVPPRRPPRRSARLAAALPRRGSCQNPLHQTPLRERRLGCAPLPSAHSPGLIHPTRVRVASPPPHFGSSPNEGSATRAFDAFRFRNDFPMKNFSSRAFRTPKST